MAQKGWHPPDADIPRISLGNGYNERFNGTLRREVLNAEWFHTTKQAQVAINAWLRQYNKTRPHHALNMRPPIPETLIKKPQITGAENEARQRAIEGLCSQ